jgi:hypothetical protein
MRYRPMKAELNDGWHENRDRGPHTVGVPVIDQERALDFYSGKLGLEKRIDSRFVNGPGWI